MFDGGTLVLSGLAPTQVDSPIPAALVWDARIEQYRAPAHRYREVALWLRHREGALNDVFQERARTDLWAPPDLRDYQHAALLSWRSAGRTGLVVLPTGAGKTRLACAAMATVRCAVLCLVPTRALLHQWRQEIARHYRGRVGCVGDGEHHIDHVTVATFEGGYRHMSKIGNRFGLLVVDEAHHFGAGVRAEALEMCAAPLRLGLTATAPPDEALARLAKLLGPVVCKLAVADLAGEWLAEFDTVVLELRLSLEEWRQYASAVATFRSVFDDFRALRPNAKWTEFVGTASRSEQGRAALHAFRSSRRLTGYAAAKRAAVAELLSRHRANRVLVFTSDNETAYHIAREQFVMPITCEIERAEREQALEAFRSGELRALVSARVLNEGIDVPDADVAIIVGGASGQREHVQRVGRLLRPVPGKRALVYELIAAGTHEVRKAAERRRALDSETTS
ncbi:MAG TPA: DEAD/DEAH box helicase family protein [Polyangiales bacterium]|nr:DEAD/DEAH box helicase family protein [Polyangiales bacterium]